MREGFRGWRDFWRADHCSHGGKVACDEFKILRLLGTKDPLNVLLGREYKFLIVSSDSLGIISRAFDSIWNSFPSIDLS